VKEDWLSHFANFQHVTFREFDKPRTGWRRRYFGAGPGDIAGRKVGVPPRLAVGRPKLPTFPPAPQREAKESAQAQAVEGGPRCERS
jgi:hypothetical protein